MPRIAIIGLGSIGSRHVDNLLALGHTDLMGYDAVPNPQEHRLPMLHTLEDLLLWKPTHALVCTPPVFHAVQAEELLRAGAHVFVEKPLCLKTRDAERLCALADECKRVLAVGYMLRGHERLQRLKRWLASESSLIDRASFWCYWRRDRPATYDTRDVIAETSHELDLALWLFGPAAVAECDLAHRKVRIELAHASGVRSHLWLHADSPIRLRECELNGASLQLTVSYETDHALTASYRAELVAFLDGHPLCTGREGLAVVELLEQLR